MREITDDEKKLLLVDLLSRFASYCKTKSISWSVTAGTLLGAVRHNGFIPWDDDIDVAVPRADFFKLLHALEVDQEGLDNFYMTIVEFDEHENSYHKRFKIADTRTTMTEYGKERPAVFIDVFPRDTYKKDGLNKSSRKRVLLLDNLLVLCHSGQVSGDGIKRVIYSFLLFAHRILGLSKMESFYEKIVLSMTKSENRGWSGSTEGSYGDREFSPGKCYSSMVYIPFESIKVPCPTGYDSILTNLYGDYMTPPPKEKQHNHSYYRMYWKED